MTLMYSQNGSSWTTVQQNDTLFGLGGSGISNFSVDFTVPTTGNYFIYVFFTETCNGKTVICLALPFIYPVTGAWENDKIVYLPIYCFGC